ESLLERNAQRVLRALRLFARGRGVVRYGAGRQVFPPSLVTKVRPSEVVTVAFAASAARTAARSIASGDATRCQVRPSGVSTTTPGGLTSQQTVGDGAAPAVSVAPTPVASACHVAPPSIDRSMRPRA